MDELRKALIRMARGDDIGERPAPSADLRFVAQLNMLHSIAATLARLDDVAEITRRSPKSSGRSSTTTTAAST